jgi:hypothetical protein
VIFQMANLMNWIGNSGQNGAQGTARRAPMDLQGAGKRAAAPGGLAGWLLRKLQGQSRREPKLALLERINIAPKQSLALVEADGRRFLVATSPEGSPAFYALNDRASSLRGNVEGRRGARVSW